MATLSLGQEYAAELKAESFATRKCLERVPENKSEWRPHEKSMTLGYLSLLVAEIPKWLTIAIRSSEIDFATFEHFKPNNTAELVKHFDENFNDAFNELQNISNEALAEPFYLKSNGQVVFTSSKKETIGSSINHMVHHRGQLTVYLRLNDVPVPSIYGPSADDRGF